MLDFRLLPIFCKSIIFFLTFIKKTIIFLFCQSRYLFSHSLNILLMTSYYTKRGQCNIALFVGLMWKLFTFNTCFVSVFTCSIKAHICTFLTFFYFNIVICCYNNTICISFASTGFVTRSEATSKVSSRRSPTSADWRMFSG